MLIKKTTGMSPTWFRDVFGQMSTLSQSTGYDCSTIQNGVELTDMFSIVPSDTYPTHATMYTGDPAGEHGMASMGGFVDRDEVEYRDVASLYDRGELVNAFDNPGHLDQFLIDKGYGHDTFLARIGKHNNRYISVVAGNMYKLGGTRYLPPLEKKFGLLAHEEYMAFTHLIWPFPVPLPDYILSVLLSGAKAAKADELAFEHATDDLKSEHADLITIYTWQTDHGGHSHGMEYQMQYLTGKGLEKAKDNNVEQYLDDFWNGFIVPNNMERNAMFILFDDHGRVDVTGGTTVVMRPQSESLKTVWEKRFIYEPDLNDSEITFGDDGTLLQIYLRDKNRTDDDKWESHPPFEDVKDFALEITRYNIDPDYREAIDPFNGQIKYVLITDHLDGDTCGDNYCGVEWSGNTVTGIEPDLSAYFEAAGDTLLEPHVDTIDGVRSLQLSLSYSSERRSPSSELAGRESESKLSCLRACLPCLRVRTGRRVRHRQAERTVRRSPISGISDCSGLPEPFSGATI